MPSNEWERLSEPVHWDHDEWAWAGGLGVGLLLGFIIGALLMAVLLG